VHVCMEALPSSIEAALLEAGFSVTEIVILKRLLEEDAMTLRQLALKTGKSTGVLDQAMKKLLKKGIVTKETINDNPKYVLQSLQSILRWMERDMEEKQDLLVRRHKNFETFIATLSVDKERPEMEHFEGEEGMKKAYIKLMDYGQEMLVYMPMLYKEEEDPLRDFRVQLFRERRHRGIFQRIIAHESPLGRRFQSRDMFEYRKTILVPEQAVPIGFEQTIIGDLYACFDHDARKAVFIRFPRLAQSERAFFESLWESPHREVTIHEVEHREPPSEPQPVSLKTRILSSFREFILSRKSIAALSVIAVLSGALTFGLHRYTQNLTVQRIKDQVRAVAATAASQFNPEDLEKLQTEGDWQKPEWAKVVGQLRDVRVNNPDLLFAYIFRQSNGSPNAVEFVADSHSLDPYANLDVDPTNDVDVNNDGKIDSVDYLQWPGQPYSTAPAEAKMALESANPSTNSTFYTDHWGTMISGYAPIRNSREEIVAVLAVDIEAAKLTEFSGKVFQPLIFFLFLFVLFIVIRIGALNRSLMQELFKTMTLRNWVSGAGLLTVVLIGLIYTYQRYHFLSAADEMGRRMQAVAVTSAQEFSAEDLRQIRWARDMKTDAYQRVFKKLNEIRTRNPEVQYAFILRPINTEQKLWEFVADADANHFLPSASDLNVDGQLSEADENPTPGTAYYIVSDNLKERGMREAFYEIDPAADQWGRFLTASAPIYDGQGNPVAILNFSIELSKVQERSKDGFGLSLFTPDELIGSLRIFIYFTLFFAVFLLIRFAKFDATLTKEVSIRLLGRRALLSMAGVILVLLAAVYGLYAYSLHETRREMGERMKLAAAAAAAEFKVSDLNQIHWARDMKSEAYQRLFQKLNEIRNKVPGVQYISILRPTADPELFEFVADADTNHFSADLDQYPYTLVPPGMIYNIESTPELVKDWRKYPMVTDVYYDVWGKWISTSAPIFDEQGKAVAMMNLSYNLEDLEKATRSKFLLPSFSLNEVIGSFRIIFSFAAIFIVLGIIGFWIYQKALRKEVINRIMKRKTLGSIAFVILLIVGLLCGLYAYSFYTTKQEIGERLKSIAATAAPEFDPTDIQQIHWAKDMQTEAYQRVFQQLNDVRNRNPGLLFVYIFRPTNDPDIVEFVVDADTNYVLPFYVRDFNEDGEFGNTDAAAPPGTSYFTQGDHAIREGFKKPVFGDIYTDQWGTFLTGCAPILDKGQGVAAFCIDMDVGDIYKRASAKFMPF
jgi:predicted transcriptional regulator